MTALKELEGALKSWVSAAEGERLLARVLCEARAPGLRRLHAALSELLGGEQGAVALAPDRLGGWLARDPELTPALWALARDLEAERGGGWWAATREVAECGATREVLTRLVYKRLASELEVAGEAERRGRLAGLWLRGAAGEGLRGAVTRGVEGVVAEVRWALAEACLTHFTVPSASELPVASRIEWLHLHRALLDTLHAAAWREAPRAMKALARLSPRAPQVPLCWALLRALEGATLESFEGVERALSLAPEHAEVRALAARLPAWRLALAPPPAPPPEPEPEPPPLPAEPMTAATDRASAAQLRAARGGAGAGASAGASAGAGAGAGAVAGLEPSAMAVTVGEWGAAAELARALSALGPARTHAALSQAALAEVAQVVLEARVQVQAAGAQYPEAAALRASAQRLAQAHRLLERALSVAPAGAPLPPSLTPPSVAFDPPLTSLSPPPLPDFQTVAPTAVISALSTSRPTTEGPLSLVEQGAPLDFTLEPEASDRARARAQMRAGELTQAEHTLLTLLDQDPFDPRVHNDLGVLYFQLHRFGDAKAHLILSVECDPAFEEAWENLTELFTSLGQLHHALPLFRRFEPLLATSPAAERLRALASRFAPEGLSALPAPTHDPADEPLRLPLTGSFFLSPEAGEDPIEALSGPAEGDWSPPSARAVTAERAQRELAAQLRADVQGLLDAWSREALTPPPPPTGLVPWLRQRLGRAPAPSTAPLRSPFDDLSLGGEGPSEGLSEALDEAARAGDPTARPLPVDMRRVRNIAFPMLCVPSGTFLMGATPREPTSGPHESPRHRVVLSRPFQLAQYPVTQELYEAVMWLNPSHDKAPGHPVVRVSWFDAVRFCNALSDLEGLPHAYVISRGARPEVAFVTDSLGYRLPTEAEWEYCARARQGFIYSGSDSLGEVGWSKVESLQTVGRKAPNAWGFHDLSGDVWEWCADGLREYSGSPQLDPRGDMPPYMHTPSARVIRGGSWCFESDGARVAFRGRGAPGLRITSLGFRLARSV